MDQSTCVLLEALKQFIENPEVTGLTGKEQEEQLESMSQKSAARAKQMLARLAKKKRERKVKVAESPVAVIATTPEKETYATVAAKATTVATAPPPVLTVEGPTLLPPYAAMVLSASQATLIDDKLSISLPNLRAITKGQDYFSRDPVYAVDVLQTITKGQVSLSVILQAGNIMELRDVLDAQFTVDRRVVEFTLGDMQVADGGELQGELSDVQLFFGNLYK